MKLFKIVFWLAFCTINLSHVNANPFDELFSQKGDNEQAVRLTYKEKSLFGFSEYKLEATVYLPRESNGKLVCTIISQS